MSRYNAKKTGKKSYARGRRAVVPNSRYKTRRRIPVKRAPRRMRASYQPARAVRKPNLGASSAAASMAVIARPFSSATSQPKIPDGKMATSLSRRQQKVFELTNEEDGDDKVYILMYASEGVACTVFGAGVPSQYQGFVNQTSQRQMADPNADGVSFLNNESGVAQWRTVSQGLKLKLINNNEENDGYWEAIRIPLEKRTTAMSLVSLSGETTGTTPHYTRALGLFFDLGYKTYLDNHLGAMVESPGYESGLLRDIDKKEFVLQHSGDSSELQTNTASIGMLAQDYTDSAFKYELSSSPTSRQVENEMLDDSMDMVLIKLTCRPNDSNTESFRGSRFLCNAIKNVEFAHSLQSDNKAFETINQAHPRISAHFDNLNNNQSASICK